ncbi:MULTISPECIES: hypothetical protein [unclassified Nostoc]|uniref:hypothetical protein n=1 Tax=unclassified Nostoc TaxID=2593658 RepID=UPI00132E98C1|nr:MULTISPECIES: hypothetical protein [unclassified Nostoc]MBD2510981.1 hypothetical protein [Desmonostoc muscorum FACHB-395]MBD2523252.1 hypothetical protein [Nostoc sp. FACHB-133]MBE8985762.1 hypothetical protein [Nostoc sp. LEGE 12450]QHG17162.1 hypothetical protein GJB62_15080 [Nostoc sp. ATCC 53789]
MTTNPQSLTGVVTAFPGDSSFDLQKLAGIGFVVANVKKFDGVDEYRNNRVLL